MELSGGLTLDGGLTFIFPVEPPSGPVSGDASVTLGTTVNWSSNTWLYIAEGRANTSLPSEYAFDTNNMVWQLCYAHRSIRLPVSSGPVSASGGGARWSTIVRQSGTNTPWIYGVVGASNSTKTDLKSNTDILLSSSGPSISYSANTLYAGRIDASFTVPANRFFLLGITGGPFYKNYKRTANNYTAVNNGNAIVTILNEAYTAGWPSGPGRGVPTQLGGNVSSYMKLASNILLAAIKFEIV